MTRLAFSIALICIVVLCGWWYVPASETAATASSQNTGSTGEFPSDWYFGGRSKALIGMEGKSAPALNVKKEWIGDPQKLSDLKGKVVVLDFWATWCPPCVGSLPKNVDLVKKYEDKGLVFIGVHESNRGVDKMPAMAKSKNLNYPLAVDDSNKTVKAYNVGFFPTYVAIDHKGKIRAAGLAPHAVENVVKKLIEEKEKGAPPTKN